MGGGYSVTLNVVSGFSQSGYRQYSIDGGTTWEEFSSKTLDNVKTIMFRVKSYVESKITTNMIISSTELGLNLTSTSTSSYTTSTNYTLTQGINASAAFRER